MIPAPENRDDTHPRIIRYREALNEALREEMRRDPRIFLLGEGIGERGGSFRVTAGLLDEFGRARVIDTPIAEASFTGIGIGAAMTGMRPVVEVGFVDFTLLVMDQVCNQAAKYHFMTGGTQHVPIVLRTQGGVGEGLGAQHSQSLEALFYHIPGLRIAVPATPYDAKGLLKSAIRCDDPVIFIEHKLLYPLEGEVPEEDYLVDFGRADIKRAGTEVTLIAWSNMVNHALAAAERLSEAGIQAEVIDPRTLVPLDTAAILASARKTGRVVIAQEAVRRGGVASDIASIIQGEVFADLKAPIEIVAGLISPVPYNKQLEGACIPGEDDIYAAVKRIVGA